MKKRKFALCFTALCMAVSCFSFVGSAEKATPLYVALGDSITYGTRLEDPETERYSTLLGEEWDADVVNNASNGLTSAELLAALEATINGDEEALQAIRPEFTLDKWNALYDADVISFGIGSNDLLKPFLKHTTEYMGMSMDEDDISGNSMDIIRSMTPIEFLKMIKDMAEYIQTDVFSLVLASGMEGYSENLPKIVDALRTINPDAQVLALDFYNCFYGLDLSLLTRGMVDFDMSAYTDGYIQDMNKILRSYLAGEPDIALVSIYDVFNQEGLTNIDVSTLDFDVHPNAEGHKEIARQFLNVLPEIGGDVNSDAAGISDDITALALDARNESDLLRGRVIELLCRASGVTKDKLIESKVILGDDDGELNLDECMSREQFAVVLARLTDFMDIETTDSQGFFVLALSDNSDVSEWAADSVDLMLTNGIMFTTCGEFRPADTVTGIELAYACLALEAMK